MEETEEEVRMDEIDDGFGKEGAGEMGKGGREGGEGGKGKREGVREGRAPISESTAILV